MRKETLQPGYDPGLLHTALVLSGSLGRVSPLALAPTWLALAAVACWPWVRGAGTNLAPTVAVMSLFFTLADGVGLALLPRTGRSFGPVTPPLLALTLIRTIFTFVIGLLPASWPSLALTAMLQLAITIASLYATWIEPFRIGVTRAELRSPKLDGHTPLRLLHITDLHIERITARERELLRLAEELSPDAILITGDYLSISSVHDERSLAEARDLLARLCASGPVYAITGSPPVDLPEVVPAIFEGLPITWLLDEVEELRVNGHVLRLAGLRCTHERHADVPRLRRLLDGDAERAFTLLLYHSPDLMPEAVELGVDLYLCGHTHGGQVRLPLFGALVTSSHFGKRYEMGRYEEAATTLYVSRGLGMEGMGAPRARFLAPPEIVLWSLSS
ncbi:MAG: hypothetical protein U9R15_04970 [Chloroflexota bacterium]|nr:hypothetical protein [Chloroflexota bacterium]